MSNEEDFDAELDVWLSDLNKELSAQNVPFHERPFRAVIMLLQNGVLTVSERGHVFNLEERDAVDFVNSDWFYFVIRRVYEWYKNRFGEAFNNSSKDYLVGFVLFDGTPTEFHVPTHLISPSRQSDEVWIQIPDSVALEEEVLGWLVNPPNIAGLKADERAALDKEVREVAGSLRFVSVTLLGVGGNESLINWCRSVTTHLESAAAYSIGFRSDRIQKGWWELQMAIESSVKALLLEKNGAYEKTHGIDRLLSDAESVGLKFDKGLLSFWPSQNEKLDLRYAQGHRDKPAEYFDAYKAVIKLARACAECMVGMQIGKGRFKIRRPPWLK